MGRPSYYTAYNTQKLVRLDFQAFLGVFCLAYDAPIISHITCFFHNFFTFFEEKGEKTAKKKKLPKKANILEK